MENTEVAGSFLFALGVQFYSQRHVGLVNAFIEDDSKKLSDIPELLTSLGKWDASDLAIAENWFTTYTDKK